MNLNALSKRLDALIANLPQNKKKVVFINTLLGESMPDIEAPNTLYVLFRL